MKLTISIVALLSSLVTNMASTSIAGTSHSEQAATISVGPNIQVSTARAANGHDEVLIASDPSDAHHLLACSMVGFSPSGHIFTASYASFDGGLTWLTGVNDPTNFSEDPSCSYGLGGSAHFLSISQNAGESKSWLTAFRSEDSGRTWTSAIVPDSNSSDRTYVIADTTHSKYRGRLYIIGQTPGSGLDDNPIPDGMTLWRSLDGGQNYQRPVRRFPSDSKTAFWPGNPVILSDGNLVDLVLQVDPSKRNDGWAGSYLGPAIQPSGTLKVLASRDGGETLAKATVLGEAYVDWRGDSSGCPSLAVDSSTGPFKDRLYAVWADSRVGGRDQIMLSYSADKGKTWSNPSIVNDDRQPAHGGLERNAGTPVVAVNNNGVVGVVWHDRRNNTTDETSYYERFAASFDGGETFAPSTRVSSKPRVFGKNEQWSVHPAILLTKGVAVDLFRGEWGAGGHTGGLAADANGVFHPLWIDNRTGIHQLWTAAVTVQGDVLRNGSFDLSQLRDLSASVKFEVTDSAYDPATHVVRLNVRLKNSSKSALHGPIKFRATTITSDLGAPSAMNADNGSHIDGAVWDFVASDGELRPDESTSIRQFLFHLNNPIQYREGRQFQYGAPGMLSIRGKVLGSR